MNDNFIMATDSYKVTHHQMYTPNTTEIYSYFECRNGAKFNDICFFGLQYIITRYFTAPITQYNIDQAEAYFDTHFGKDVFNRKGWEYILNKHNGYLPLEIRAIPEGPAKYLGSQIALSQLSGRLESGKAELISAKTAVLSEVFGAL